MCLYNKPKKECPICLQEKKLTTKCKICTDTMICQDCCLNLCEKGLCGKCPVCRQPNWKQPKKTQIMPKLILKFKSAEKEEKEEKESPEVFPQIDREEDCCDTCYKIKNTIFTIFYIFAACMIVYVLGMFTVFIFTSGDIWKDNPHLYWVSALVGIVWVGMAWSPCCCGKTLSNVYCHNDVY